VIEPTLTTSIGPIRINYGDPITGQTGRWLVPFDFRAGKKFTDNVALSLEIGVPIVRDYPVCDLKTQLRVNVRGS
jgi:hypothetical protein